MQPTGHDAPVYREACNALPPIPSNTEYRATLLSKFATALAAGCDIVATRDEKDAAQYARDAATKSAERDCRV